MKVIFLDIDGTLTVAGENIPPQSAIDAIRAAQKRGHQVFLCTGRSWSMSESIAAYGFDGAITSAGGYIAVGDDVIYNHPMEPDELRRVLEIMRDPNIFPILETNSMTFADLGAERFDQLSGPMNSELIRWRKAVTESFAVRPLREYRGEPAYKLSFLCLRRDALTRPERLLSDRYQFCLQDFLTGDLVNGELISRAFDKGRALRRVCDFLRVPIADSIAFGDSMNDLEMIEAAGIGVCMGNGSPTLKAASDKVCPAAEKDGLAIAFRELGLIS